MSNRSLQWMSIFGAASLVMATAGTSAAEPDLAEAAVHVAETTVVEPAVPQATAPTERHVVHADVESHNYMATIAWSAIMGGLLGAAVGTAVYYLDKGERARNIVYWTAGGVLVGAGVGVVQVMVEESRLNQVVLSSAPTDPARTFRFSLYHHSF